MSSSISHVLALLSIVVAASDAHANPPPSIPAPHPVAAPAPPPTVHPMVSAPVAHVSPPLAQVHAPPPPSRPMMPQPVAVSSPAKHHTPPHAQPIWWPSPIRATALRIPLSHSIFTALFRHVECCVPPVETNRVCMRINPTNPPIGACLWWPY